MQPNIKTTPCAAENLVKYLLRTEYQISVGDSEGTLLKRSSSYTDVMETIESVDECYLIAVKDGKKSGWAMIVMDCPPDERVADYTCGPDQPFDAWFEQFEATIN